MLDLSPDQVLATTRSVRRRLDFDRPVDRAVVEECLELAFQAPNGGNMNSWRWIAIDDPAVIADVAGIYNGGLDDYIGVLAKAGGYPGAAVPGAERIEGSVAYLREHFHRSPVVVVPLLAGRMEGANTFFQASQWGSIIQAVWSFFLALRVRGMGSAWTTGHLWREQALAERLGIPHEAYTQVGLFPVAFTKGTEFKPAYRKPLDEVLDWNRFSA